MICQATCEFVTGFVKRPACVSKTGAKRKKSYACFKLMLDDNKPDPLFVEAVAAYVVYFGRLQRTERQRLVIDWVWTSGPWPKAH